MARCIYLFNQVEYKFISGIKMFPQKHCNLITGKYKITKSFEACCLLVLFFQQFVYTIQHPGFFRGYQKTSNTPLWSFRPTKNLQYPDFDLLDPAIVVCNFRHTMTFIMIYSVLTSTTVKMLSRLPFQMKLKC